MDQLTKNVGATFLAGTSNAIFIHHKACAIDVVAHVATGQLEIINSAISPLISLSTPDKKFIDDIVTLVESSWTGNTAEDANQFDFQGSDDDIRARFEHYITQLLVTMEYCQDPEQLPANNPNNISNL